MGLFGGRKKQNNWAISLDIGTEFVKALVFEVIEGEGHIRGVGRARQRLSDMQGGGITDIHGVAQNCEKAIEQAATQAQFLPDKAIVGIAGELVKGATTTVKVTRQKPQTQIQVSELQDIVNQVQAQAFTQARKELAEETGLEEIDIQLVNAAIVSVVIDGYKVSNPMSYQGKELSVGVYNAFAPIVQFGALETVVRELNLELLAIAAEPYAVARCLNEESTDFAATFIDIGGGTTDIAVVRNGGVDGTKMFAIGGRAFTKRVAAVLGETFQAAEEAKIAYSSGKLDKEKAELVRHALKNDTQVWLSALQISLEDFGEGDLLPSKILLCGGGSNLPEIKEVLSDREWSKDLPFARAPEVQFIKPNDVANMVDETKTLQDISQVTPMALGNVALDLIGQTSMLETLMKKALSGVKQ
ncbi:MAG: pilus assembly protein PilM [Candidatus Berkelbacteria bacterium]|nr:pilus assembly protein PilM [Candidatus Berkelbacteria bacterium]MCR4307802.1 pilus assembly protein PilM [Candidatus Berkelbacteria bacterium]